MARYCSHASGVQEASPEGWQEITAGAGQAPRTPTGEQEASPEGWQEISPGWSASDTRGCLFSANRTPEGCEDNLDSGALREGSGQNLRYRRAPANRRIGPTSLAGSAFGCGVNFCTLPPKQSAMKKFRS